MNLTDKDTKPTKDQSSGTEVQLDAILKMPQFVTYLEILLMLY